MPQANMAHAQAQDEIQEEENEALNQEQEGQGTESVSAAASLNSSAATSTITVTKIVINDSGTGTSTVSDFPLFINGESVESGEAVELPFGSYTISETSKPNYKATFSGDCNSRGHLGLGAGQDDECIITNDDIPEDEPGTGGSTSTDPIECSFDPKEGRKIVSFDPDKKIRSDQTASANNHVSGPESVSLDAGTYKVSLMSYDDDIKDQKWEEWQVVFKNGTSVVATSSAIDDLPHGTAPRTLSQMVDSSLVLDEDVDSVLAWHAFWPNNAHTSEGVWSPNSVFPVCAAFDMIDEQPEPEDEVKVHIYKYLDGVQATASSSDGYHFPMTSTWDAENIGAGTGSYVLGNSEGGASEQYAADTSFMSAPADYTTSEVTTATDNSSKVLPAGAECAEGKYRLQGYTSGTTFASAASATPTTSAPAFTDITSDRYVIVWNEICDGDQEPDPTPTLELQKSGSYSSSTGNVTFTIDWRVLGAGSVSDLVITDPIATSTTFVSAGQGGTINAGTISWNLGPQTASATGTVSFQVDPVATGTLPCSISNTAFALAHSGNDELRASSTATVILNQNACDGDDDTSGTITGTVTSTTSSSTTSGTIGGGVDNGNVLTGTVSGGGGGGGGSSGGSRNSSNNDDDDDGAGQVLGATDATNPTSNPFAPGQVLGATSAPGFPSTGEKYEGYGEKEGAAAAILMVLALSMAPLAWKKKEA